MMLLKIQQQYIPGDEGIGEVASEVGVRLIEEFKEDEHTIASEDGESEIKYSKNG